MSSAGLELSDRIDLDAVEEHHLALGGIVLLGSALRAYGLGAESLWFDETFTAGVVAFRSLEYVLFELPRVDPHPTFYYVVLKGWTAIAGTSEVGLRSLSVAADLGSVALIYLLGRRLYDRRVGLFAGLLFALSPFYVWYGREARMYALLTLLSLSSGYLLVRMVGGDRRRRTAGGYLLATVALCYTHAFGPLVVAAQNIYLAGAFLASWRSLGVLPERIGGLRAGRWVGLQLATAVAVAPYYEVLYRQTFVTERLAVNVAWIPEAAPGTVWDVLGSYVGRAVPPTAPWGREPLWAFGPGGVLSIVGEAVTLAALGLVVYALVGYWQADGVDREAGDGVDRETGDGRVIAPEPLLAAWAFAPIVVLYALSVSVRPVLYDRFTAPFGVALVLLLARGLSRLVDDRSRLAGTVADDRRRLAAVAVATAVVLAVPLAGLHAAPQKPQVREAAAILEEDAGSGESVVVSPRWDDSYSYYLEDWHEPGPPEGHGLNVQRVRAGAGRPSLRRVTVGADVVWLVVSFATPDQRERMVTAMEGLGYEVDRHEALEKVDVYRFVAG